MKNSIKIIITGLFALSAAYGQEKGIKLINVYEKSFNEPIVDVIFDTATVSIKEAKKMGWKDEAFTKEEKSKGKAVVSYPKVVFVSRGKRLGYYAPATKRSSNTVKEIRFYDKNGVLLNTIEIGKQGSEWIHISPNSKYILVSKIPTEYNPDYSGGTLYDCEGRKIGEIEGPTPIAISDEGYTVATNLDWQVPPEPGGSFYIYDPTGRLLKTVENPDKKRSAPLFAKYTKDGEYAVLVFKGTTAPPTIIYLIKKTGEILWKKEFPEYRFSGRGEEMDMMNEGITGIFDLVKLSPPGQENWRTYIFYIDLQGNLRWKVPLEIRGNMIVKHSEGGKNVYVSSTEGYLWSIDMYQGEVIWKHKEPWSPEPQIKKEWPWEVPLFCELEIIDDTLYLIGKQGRNWHSSTLFIFDGKSGSLLRKMEYPHEKISFVETGRGIGLVNISKRMISIFKKEVLK